MQKYLSAIEFSGGDALSFLQGQFSCDIRNLDDPTKLQFGTYLNHQGRMLSSFLIHRVDQNYRLVMHHSLVERIVKRLSMFVLRAEVEIRILADPRLVVIDPDLVYESRLVNLRVSGQRLYLSDRRFISYEDDLSGTDLSIWKRADILDSVFWVSESTYERYVPQMCNFDCFGDAISFKKGCYVGQEIVARVRYLGSVKRRMFIFRSCSNKEVSDTLITDAEGNNVGEIVFMEGDLILAVLKSSADLDNLRIGRRISLENIPLCYEFPVYTAGRNPHS